MAALLRCSISLLMATSLFDFTSCQPKNKLEDFSKSVLKSEDAWLKYTRSSINLCRQFVSYDSAGLPMDKGMFLYQIAKGEFFPLRLTKKDSLSHYQLLKIPPNVNDTVVSSIKNLGNHEYQHFLKEGKDLPNFDFTDIEGINYNKENTKGKILIIKCWFIACKPCVEEIPELNDLVSKYSSRKDIVFISLALDSEDKLKKFLKYRKFDYKIIGDQKHYLMDIIKMNVAPTHIVVNPAGKVDKIVNSSKELFSYLSFYL